MTRRFTGLAMIGVLLVGMPASLVVAQQSDAPGEHAAHHPPQKAAEHADAAQGQPGMMQGMSEPMKLKCQMMMKMEVKATDPAALVAVQDQLGLTDEQTAAIKDLQAKTREATNAILTDEQRQKLQELGELPATHMAMHQMMMQKMKGKMQAKKGGMMGMQGKEMMCPMMAAMKQQTDKPADENGNSGLRNEPARDKHDEGGHQGHH